MTSRYRELTVCGIQINQSDAHCVNPDQSAREEASDQNLHCLQYTVLVLSKLKK